MNWITNFRRTLSSCGIACFFIVAISYCISVSYGQEAMLDQATPQQFFDALNLDYPGMEKVKQAIEKKDYSAASAAYLEFRRHRSRARYLIDYSAKPSVATESEASQKDRIKRNIWGSYIFTIIEKNIDEIKDTQRQEIDWFYNPRSPKDTNYSLEIVWNTNRQNWWKSLADSYWATLDERYTREWIAELTGWIQKCPGDVNMGIETAEQSPTWRPLEVGIRMHDTWPYSYYHFLGSSEFTPEAHLLFVASCLEQGRFLNRITTENASRTGNHVTTECIGLATVACLFPELRESDTFVQTAISRLTRELSRQVYPDGAQIELTPWYHNTVVEAYTDLDKILSLNGRSIPPAIDKTLLAMNRYYVAIMDQQGRLPLFNDSSPLDACKLLKEPAKHWSDPEFEFVVSEGKKGRAPALSTCLPYAGFYAMRSDWSANGLYACFRGGPAGAGHWHEDKLQFVISAFGQQLVIDPGRYTYDQSEWRNYVIRTSSHNTITVDGKEQKRGGDDYGENPKEVGNPWMVTPAYDFVSSQYDNGYWDSKYVQREYYPISYLGTADKSIVHTRYFFFLKPSYFVAVDLLTGSGVHHYESHFNLDAPNVTIDSIAKCVRTNRTDSAQIALFPMDNEDLEVRKAIGEENPILGWSLESPESRRPISTIVYTKKQAAPASFGTLFYPFQEDMPNVTSNPLSVSVASCWAKHIETPSDALELVINPTKTTAQIQSSINKTITSDAAVVVVRRLKGEDHSWLGIYDGATVVSEDVSFFLEGRGNLLVRFDNSPGKISDQKLQGLSFFNPTAEPIIVHVTKPFQRIVTVLGNKFQDVK